MNLINCKAWHVYHSSDFEIGDLWEKIKDFVNHKSSLNIISETKHYFDNGGFTGLYLLSESHLAIHYWIEFQYIWLELSSCGNIDDFAELEKFLCSLNLKINIDYENFVQEIE